MSSSEVDRLLSRRDERICVRVTRDVDDAIITADRPQLWQRSRAARVGLSSAAIAAAIPAWHPARVLAAPLAAAQLLRCGPTPPAASPASPSDENGSLAGTIWNQINQGFGEVIVRAVSEATGAEYWTETLTDGTYRLQLPK